jgi:hypothetical protein
MSEVCADCETVKGSCTRPFVVEMPFCGRQLISCECISKILELNLEEVKVFHDYEDDSAEPLARIVRRWVNYWIAMGVFRFKAALTQCLNGCRG